MMTRTLQLFSLQNDCLMNIFMFLNFKEIVRIDTCTTNRRDRETWLAVLKTLTLPQVNLGNTASCVRSLRFLLLRDIIVKELIFPPSSTLTDLAICTGQLLIQSLRGLTSVNLSECANITDTVLASLAGGCPGFTSVYLCGCLNITDAGLASLAGGCAGLTSVNLWGCVNITDAGLDILKEMGCKVSSSWM